MNYTLKLADDDDIMELCEIDLELFPENNFNERTLGIELSKGVCWITRQDDPGYPSYPDIAGYVLCRIVDNTLVDILRLGVREPYRNRGIATKLLRAAMSISGHTMLCVRKNNDPAIRLYQRHGLVITGSMPQHYSWVMEFKRTASSP